MTDGTTVPTQYQILQVHHAAPPDLIAAAYWRLTARAQAERSSKAEAGIALYHFTKAYETLADSKARSTYDASLGLTAQSVVPELPRKRRGILLVIGSANQAANEAGAVDSYELLRLDPAVDSAFVSEAYGIMRVHYNRLVRNHRDRVDLLGALELARDLLTDPARRTDYDHMRTRRQAAHIEEPPADDLPAEDSAVIAAETNSVEQILASNASLPTQNVPTVRGRVRLVKRLAMRMTPRRTLLATARNSELLEVPAEPGEGEEVLTPTERESLQTRQGRERSGGGRAFVKAIARKAADRFKETLNADDHSDQVGADEAERLFLQRLSAVPGSTSKNYNGATGNARVLARLAVVGGPNMPSSFEMRDKALTIGAGMICNVRLPDLADIQARLLHHDGSFVLYTLAVEAPSVVHGDTGNWAVLESGDTFDLGPHRLRFESLAPEPVSA